MLCGTQSVGVFIPSLVPLVTPRVLFQPGATEFPLPLRTAEAALQILSVSLCGSVGEASAGCCRIHLVG